MEVFKNLFVILTYDVGVRRDRYVLKICRKYLHHVQKSVFEGTITEAKLNAMKQELEKKIKWDSDAVRIYKLESLKYISKEEIGVVTSPSNII